jgi:hypothetical protein
MANATLPDVLIAGARDLSLRDLSFAGVGHKLDNFSATFSYKSFEERHQQNESRTPIFGP